MCTSECLIKKYINTAHSTFSTRGEACACARTGCTSSIPCARTCSGGSVRQRKQNATTYVSPPALETLNARVIRLTTNHAAPHACPHARAPTHHPTHTRAHRTRTRTRIVVRTFCVMYRDIPITPDSRCSVHSKVTCKRTSFFFDAAVTTSAPREGAWRCADDDGAALSAEVLAMDVRAASMAASGGREWRGVSRD